MMPLPGRLQMLELQWAAGEALPFKSIAFENGVILESEMADDVQVSWGVDCEKMTTTLYFTCNIPVGGI